jgi:hypothetical protein
MSALRVADGSEIVLVEAVVALWHLPARGTASLDRKTLCGLRGPVFIYGPITRERRCCSVCADRAPKGTLIVPKRRRPGARSVPQLTNAQVQVCYQLYADKLLGVPAIGELVWQRLGFKNATSCANAIGRAFDDRGLKLRTRAASHRRTVEGKRLVGFGGTKPGEQRLTGPIVDRLYELYKGGLSVPELAAAHAEGFGYVDVVRFRSVLEYGWKVCGYSLRSGREAELLSRSKKPRQCKGILSASNMRHRKSRVGERCEQRPERNSDYCFAHDPAREGERAERLAKLHAGRASAEIEWETLLPYLEPLLVTKPDRLGRHLEKPGGALARNTGVPTGTCSRLLLGRKTLITVKLANRLLEPLELSVDDILAPRAQAIAA